MAKQFLDSTGLNALWTRIVNGFAPAWKAVDLQSLTLTHNANNVVMGVSSTGPNPGSDNKDVISGVLTIQPASTTAAGVMTSADKTKLDGLSNSINSAISISGVQVKGTDLTLTNKKANFDLKYNSTTDTLDIVDANKSNTVLTSVRINDFIGDALLSGVLTSATMVDKDKNGTAGTFLKLVFTTTDNAGNQSSSEIYANVADLVSTYTNGTGISITTNNTGVDNTATSATISLKQAATNEIGGIQVSKVFTTNPTIQAATTYATRYFPIETTKEGKAIVNIPSSSLSIGNATPASGGTISHGGTFTAITGLTEVESGTDGSTTLTPTLTTYTLPSVPNISVTANTKTTGTPAHAGKFTVISAIEANGHGFKYTPTEITLPAESTLSVAGTATDSITLVPGGSNEVQVLETVTASGHTITRDFKTIKVDDPASIDVATINALAYPA